MRGLNKLQINEKQCLEELKASPELLAEPIQTILKIYNVADPYTLLKKASRGKTPTKEDLTTLVESLDIPTEVKERIHKLEPETYIGDALRICDLVLQKVEAVV